MPQKIGFPAPAAAGFSVVYRLQIACKVGIAISAYICCIAKNTQLENSIGRPSVLLFKASERVAAKVAGN